MFENVTVEPGASVEYSLIMPGSVIKSGAKVRYSIIAENVTVNENAEIGVDPALKKQDEEWGITVVGAGISVGKDAVLGAGLMITEDVEEGGKR